MSFYLESTTSKTFVQRTNDKFVPINRGGQGKDGEIWFALRSQRQSLESSNTFGSTRQLFAVKLPRGDGFKSCATEVRTLMTIEATAGEKRKHFPSIIDAKFEDREMTQSCLWFSVNAIRGFTADHLTQTADCPIPNAFVAHTYFQLTTALQFLHNSKLAHRDIWGPNIMFDTQKQCVPGFPNVVIIDFGNVE